MAAPALNNQRLDKLREATLKKVEALRTDHQQEGLDKRYEKLYRAARVFFTALYSIKYEFTYEELFAEVYAKRIDVALKEHLLAFLKTIDEKEYSRSNYSSDELKMLTDEFAALLNELTKINSAQENSSQNAASPHLFSVKKKNPGRTSRKKNEPLFLMHRILLEAHAAMAKGDAGQVRTLYARIQALYMKLSEEEKKEIYPEIQKIYTVLSS